MNPLVIETDLGHDPDDLWALLYFIAIKAPIKAILLSPGDLYQVAIARSLLGHFDLDVPVLTPKSRVSQKSIPDGFHAWVVNQLKESSGGLPDGHEDSLPTEPVDSFICGPVKMSHRLNLTAASKLTMQGGFVPYSVHRPVVALDKFEGRNFCPTFNLGGTKPPIAQALLDLPCKQTFVGKNICHTVVYTPEVHEKFCPTSTPKTEALRLHKLFVEHYIERKGAKAFHDPLAAVLSQHPELGQWMPLKPVRKSGEWGVESITGGRHESLVDLPDRDAVWETFIAGLET